MCSRISLVEAVEREKKFKKLLKDSGVTKCYIDDASYIFGNDYPSGEICVDINNTSLFMGIYKLFTKDVDGVLDDDQTLFVKFSDFSDVIDNYSLED